MLRPHVERDGCRLDRFDAYLGDELISTSRSGWHEPARKLLDMGYPPDTLLHVQHEGRRHDPTIRPQTIGELAEWTIKERDRGGLKRERWLPPEQRSGAARRSQAASPAGDDASGGVKRCLRGVT